MKIRRYITMMLFLLMYITATPQNNLSVGKLTGGQGKDVLIPISLENTDEVVALQFDLQLPFDRSSRTAPTLSQSRINEHTVSVRNLGNHKYRVVVVNMSNRPLSGNAGTIINFPMAVPTGLDPGTEYAVSLSDVIITNRKGDNIQGDSNANGSYTVQRENAPDLATTDVNITESTLVPGKSGTVTWKVSNIGNADTRSGWTERVYLVSNETEEAVHIGNTYFSNTLIQGGYIARSATFNLSQTVGLEGEVTAKVVVEPSSGCGEYNADRANNTATGGTAELEKHLFLTAPDKSVKEGESMRLTLKRSGDRSMDETFSIASSLPEHAKVPATVTISKGQSAASFDVVCPDNNVVNDYMVNTAAVYKFINDQTLTYINQGYTSDEISNMIELPEALNKIWYTRQYYGTVAHNAKAVYQKFMGWYDSNPVNLNPLMPSDSAKKWVEYLGDVDKVLQMAKADFDKGEYQWVAEVTNTIVFADPTNTDARLLCADALEQLGYQAESGPWRNEYLTAAQELRHGNANFTASTKSTGDMVKALSAPMLFDYMAIVMDKQALADRDFTMNVILPDVGEQHMLRVKNGVLLVYADTLSDDADVSITCPKNALFAILTNNQETVAKAVKVEGSAELLTLMMENMNQIPITGANPFNIIEP